jgi:hypothetical protein
LRWQYGNLPSVQQLLLLYLGEPFGSPFCHRSGHATHVAQFQTETFKKQ